MTFQFKIQLKGVQKPPVWRRIVVPANCTFDSFHQIIQVAFGWEDYHLYSFSPSGYGSSPQISRPSDDDWDETDLDSSKIKLSNIFQTEGQRYTYIYDFGDDWIHSILLEKIEDQTIIKAYCTTGKGACPPEDCGGINGYAHIKKTLENTPDSEEAAEFREWLGLEKDESWEDLFGYDQDQINEELREI